MRIGLRFYTGVKEDGGHTTLWTTITDTDKTRQTMRWGRIASAKLSYADFEITECNVTIANPSDALIRALLAVVVAEPTPLDTGLDYLSASLWVQGPRFGYDPHPIFYGLILDLNYTDGDSPTVSFAIHDFLRLQVLQRDIQDYQNLTDNDIALMLMVQLNRAANTGPGDVISQVYVDPDAIRERRTSASIGAVRKWKARLLDGTAYDRLKMYAMRLGFKISPATKVNYGGEAYSEIEIVPIQGKYEKVAGTYRRGDGEVLSFSTSYAPPSAVMTRNVMSKRFDAINEIMMLENAKDCVSLDTQGTVIGGSGESLPLGAIQGPIKLTDANNKPISLAQYQTITGPQFARNIAELGFTSAADLRAYNDRISFRKGLHVPGSIPGSVAIQNSSSPVTQIPALQENLSDTGSLFWRITAKLQTRFNPFTTTTDYLSLAGWGVWDGVYAIRTFTHDLSEKPTSTYDLTFGDPTKQSG
jgi:hypothetical protein